MIWNLVWYGILVSCIILALFFHRECDERNSATMLGLIVLGVGIIFVNGMLLPVKHSFDQVNLQNVSITHSDNQVLVELPNHTYSFADVKTYNILKDTSKFKLEIKQSRTFWNILQEEKLIIRSKPSE